MTEEKKPKGLAERQREFRVRQREAGFVQRTLWIHKEAEEQGRIAALDGQPCEPMNTRHPLSWAMGWVDEKNRQEPG
uniref:hypothetical protein n=1 Tax=Pseudomonas sp. EA_65y_Pfl2_P74 TaxID=3088694 RepID=UPI0030D9D218